MQPTYTTTLVAKPCKGPSVFSKCFSQLACMIANFLVSTFPATPAVKSLRKGFASAMRTTCVSNMRIMFLAVAVPTAFRWTHALGDADV